MFEDDDLFSVVIPRALVVATYRAFGHERLILVQDFDSPTVALSWQRARLARVSGHEPWMGWECEDVARWWQDGFTAGADPEYEEQILPLALECLDGARRIIDIGCGEGQIARLASALPRVERVVGIDPTWAQVEEAASRAGGASYARAAAAALPFGPGSFDAAVACLVFEHIRDLDGAVSEVARVLEAGGRFAFFLNHPLLQTPNSGWIDDQILDPPEQYWRIGPYLVEDETLEEVEKGVFLPFIHRPLSRYVNALAANGLAIVRMEEPAPPPGFLARAHEYADAATIPRLLLLLCERRPR